MSDEDSRLRWSKEKLLGYDFGNIVIEAFDRVRKKGGTTEEVQLIAPIKVESKQHKVTITIERIED